MYPVYIGGELVANIIADKDNWTIKLSHKFSSKDIYFEQPRLEPYKIYILTSKISGESFFLIMTPRFNSELKSYDIFNAVTIGTDPNCDVYFPLEFSKTEYMQIKLVDSRWLVETNSPFFFISGERARSGQEILSGDTIFFYGVKVIFLNGKLLIDSSKELVEKETIKLKVSERSAPSSLMKSSEKPVAQEAVPLYSEKDYFYKSPRLNYMVEPVAVEIDAPPEPDKGNDMPVILTVGPQLTMAGVSVMSMIGMIMSASSGNGGKMMMGISIGTMILTLTGTLLWPMITRKFNKRRLRKKEEKRQKKYEEYLNQKQNLINFIKANQKQTMVENHPEPEQCATIIEGKTKELWQRNISHGDFLTVRLGLGKVPTAIQIERPKEQFSIDDDDSLFLALKKTVNDALTIDAAPILYDLKTSNISAIVGDSGIVNSFMDCLFLQLLTFHAYNDLKIVVFTKEPRKWDYLRAVPHCWNGQRTSRYFCTSVDKMTTISGELEKVFNARAANDEEVQLEDDGAEHESKSSYKDFRPYYLFVVDDMAAVRNVPIINKILHYRRNIGFSIIATTQSVSSLPNETTDFVFVSRQASTVTSGDTNTGKEMFMADFNNGRVNMHLVAQSLANIPVPAEKGKFELPKSVSFLELYNFGRVEQLNSLARWNNNNPSVSLSVPIGIDQNNEIFTMDIHEKAYGPHGLIAGTTGSGKSEWIVTYILSLAVNFSPDEVQFVLIDYKGGGLAKSFENAELNIKLPHLAGTITNLDKSEIFRSISAIESELKRRQSIFNAAREKLKEGSMNIYKYQQYYRKGMVDQPMSHLLIICDEFAELKQQEPDFMDQLISTARVGRSLGVHLILATQKPSGVVNDQIWSNSKFKVCLKVQDRSDSQEILKKPDAAYLKQTGTFYLQVGNDDYYNLGQVAWAGAKYYPSDVVEHQIDESIECINDIGRVVESLKEKAEVKEAQGEELINIVGYISEVSKQVTLKGQPLWLTNIDPIVMLADLKKKYGLQPGAKYTYETLIGEYDEPRKQQQGPLKIDLAGGNIAIVGKADSSIEKLLSVIIWSSIVDHTPAEISYYIIDFGTETMKKFSRFPHVGEVVFQDEIDKVAGVFDLITEEMERRKSILSDYNGSFEYYNKVQQDKMNLMVVIINNYDVFGEVLPRAMDSIGELFRDAPRYGIIFIITSNTTNAISTRLLQFFNHHIVMQMADDSQYRNLTDCRKGLIPKKVVGRGICKTDASNVDSYCEFQTALIDSEEKEIETLRTYADQCIDYYKCKVKQLTKIPDDVTSEDLVKYLSDLSGVPIGLDIREKDITRYDFISDKLHIVTGKNIAENISFIYALASIMSKISKVKVRVIDMLGIFKKPMLDIKFFNENFDALFDALENDVRTRTDTQDYAVSLVIGAGQYKNFLSNEGIEKFKSVFEHLGESKNLSYVLIDDYDKVRQLQLEEWFTMFNSRGVWLGQGLANQSLFDCKEVLDEDKKYDFEGLAFNIADGDYKVIKTMMDKDE
ncbi:type VII secretion protein EssC [Candidatus Saccharibacteria bacterium]|nr:type VII secretion protein EssC [Candidatus Saccharibacteria bacterium]